jgi:hypothetical protein
MNRQTTEKMARMPDVLQTDGLIEEHADRKMEDGTAKNMVRHKNAYRHVDKS